MKMNSGTSPVGESKKQLVYVDEYRGGASLFVVFSHMLGTVLPPGTWFGFLVYGKYAVAVFIMISGYCLALPVIYGSSSERLDGFAFYKRRAFRILPPFYSAVAISALCGLYLIKEKTGSEWDAALPVTFKGLLANLLLVQDMWRIGEIDYPLWSVAVESQIYLLFPLIMADFSQNLRWKRMAAWFSGSYVLMYAAYHVSFLHFITGIYPNYLAYFVVGIVAAKIGQEEIPLSVPAGAWAALSLLFFLLLLLVCYPLNREQIFHSEPYTSLLMVLSAASLLVYLGMRSSPSASIFGGAWSPLSKVGTFSYSLYLIHAPLIQIVWQYLIAPLKLDRNLSFYLMCTFGAGLVVLASYGFFFIFERPFVTSRRRRAAEAVASSAVISG